MLSDTMEEVRAELRELREMMHELLHEFRDSRSENRAIAQFLATQNTAIYRKEIQMAEQPQWSKDLINAVASTRDEEAAAKMAILGLLQQIKDAADSQVDPAAMSQLVDSLMAGVDDLAAAVPATAVPTTDTTGTAVGTTAGSGEAVGGGEVPTPDPANPDNSGGNA